MTILQVHSESCSESVKAKTMKFQALEQTAIAARERARRLANAAQKADGAARAAKDKARKAKAGIKLAKREAKKLRQAAKAAKRDFSEALLAAQKAATTAASFEKKIQKLRKKSPKGHANAGKPNRALSHKRFAASAPATAATPGRLC